jgi:hydroxymethylbilane synthase
MLRIATRKSPLALWQAEHVAALLRQAHPGLEIELVPISTRAIASKIAAWRPSAARACSSRSSRWHSRKARRYRRAFHEGRPEAARGLRDRRRVAAGRSFRCLVVAQGSRLEDLVLGARVGTSSLRRQAQLLSVRPDLNIEPLRGNVDTRVRRLDSGELDAIILACAGLIRLGWESRIGARLDPRVCLPAVTQGIIGIECRGDAAHTRSLLQVLDDGATRTVMDAERAFAERLGGSCQSPIAAYATLNGARLTLDGLVAEPDGSRLLRDSATGDSARPHELGAALADRVLAAGAAELLDRLRG